MNRATGYGRGFGPAGVVMALLLVAAPVFAKRPAAAAPATPAADKQEVVKAELNATVALAGIKVSRLALVEEASLADLKEAIGAMYDRKEEATKDALTKLHDANGDKAKVSEAVAALSAADAETAKYFRKNPEVKDKIAKRAAVINTEIGQIVRTPDGYVAKLKKAGLAGDALDKAKSLVKDASKKAGGKTDADSTDAVLSARKDIRESMSAAQVKALDAALGGT